MTSPQGLPAYPREGSIARRHPPRWVYVDGNHNDPFVSQDLDLCRRKVKPGGIIAGDDFNWRSGQETPVKDAVQRLVAGLGAAAKIRLLGNQYMIRLPK
jgi:hypothetical protein